MKNFILKKNIAQIMITISFLFIIIIFEFGIFIAKRISYINEFLASILMDETETILILFLIGLLILPTFSLRKKYGIILIILLSWSFLYITLNTVAIIAITPKYLNSLCNNNIEKACFVKNNYNNIYEGKITLKDYYKLYSNKTTPNKSNGKTKNWKAISDSFK